MANSIVGKHISITLNSNMTVAIDRAGVSAATDKTERVRSREGGLRYVMVLSVPVPVGRSVGESVGRTESRSVRVGKCAVFMHGVCARLSDEGQRTGERSGRAYTQTRWHHTSGRTRCARRCGSLTHSLDFTAVNVINRRAEVYGVRGCQNGCVG